MFVGAHYKRVRGYKIICPVLQSHRFRAEPSANTRKLALRPTPVEAEEQATDTYFVDRPPPGSGSSGCCNTIILKLGRNQHTRWARTQQNRSGRSTIPTERLLLRSRTHLQSAHLGPVRGASPKLAVDTLVVTVDRLVASPVTTRLQMAPYLMVLAQSIFQAVSAKCARRGLVHREGVSTS